MGLCLLVGCPGAPAEPESTDTSRTSSGLTEGGSTTAALPTTMVLTGGPAPDTAGLPGTTGTLATTEGGEPGTSTGGPDPGSDTGTPAADGGVPDVPYVGPPCTRSFRAAPGDTNADKLEAAIAEAITDRCFDPPMEDPPAATMGPKQPQGVVRIEFAADSDLEVGGNALIFDRPVELADGLRIEVDAGVRLVYTHYLDGALFNLDKRRDITISRGDPAHGQGIRAGRFVIDASTAPPNAGKMIARAVWLKDTDRFLVEHVHTIQSWRTDTAAMIFNGSPATAAPRNGIYRHHSNEGSPQGYGPNQITSLNHSYIHDLWSEGGTTCRFETDGNHSGVHDVIVDHIFGRHGNRVLVLMPYDKSSDTITVTRVRGFNMYEGIHVGDHAGSGLFTGVTISDGCIVAGPDAQQQVKTGEYPNPFPLTASRAAVEWGAAPGTDVTVTAIGYTEADGKFSAGPGPAEHGVDPDVPCTAELAQQGP